jgi:hypothetical protein
MFPGWCYVWHAQVLLCINLNLCVSTQSIHVASIQVSSPETGFYPTKTGFDIRVIDPFSEHSEAWSQIWFQSVHKWGLNVGLSHRKHVLIPRFWLLECDENIDLPKTSPVISRRFVPNVGLNRSIYVTSIQTLTLRMTRMCACEQSTYWILTTISRGQ